MTNSNVYEQLPDFLKQAIDHEIKKATEEEIQKAIENVKKNIDERRSQIITGVLLNVQRQINFERMGDTLQVSVKIV